MNSVFVNPGIYSCAVDAFLEISTHLFLPYLSNLLIRNDFTDLLFNACSHYMSSREDSSLLGCRMAIPVGKCVAFVPYVFFFFFRVGKSLACHSPGKWCLCA